MPPKKKRKESLEKKEEKDPKAIEANADDKEEDKAPDSAFEHKIDDTVLAHHRNMLYEAKVLKRKLKKTGEPSYFIHYKGCNSKWDEWVDTARLKKLTEETLKEAEALKKGAKAIKEKEEETDGKKKSKGKKRKSKTKEESDDDDEDDTVEHEKPKTKSDVEQEEEKRIKCEIKIKIPGALKKQLVTDWEYVTRDKKLVELPKKKHSVSSIMNDYLTSKKRPAQAQKMTEEVVSGIKQYFDRAVGRVLLYKFERPQYKELNAQKKNVNCDHYGAEHLLRLFVKLPELLASTTMEKDEVSILQGRIGELIRFLDKKRGEYFTDKYVTTDKDYHEKAATET